MEQLTRTTIAMWVNYKFSLQEGKVKPGVYTLEIGNTHRCYKEQTIYPPQSRTGRVVVVGRHKYPADDQQRTHCCNGNNSEPVDEQVF